jgi:hypothetical protein
MAFRYGYDFPGDIAGLITGSIWNGQEPEKLSNTVRLLLFLYNILINTRSGKKKKEREKGERIEDFILI